MAAMCEPSSRTRVPCRQPAGAFLLATHAEISAGQYASSSNWFGFVVEAAGRSGA